MIQSMFKNVDLLGKGLDATWLRNQVITDNIANVDTPGFKTSHVEFEDIFAQSLSSSNLGMKLTRSNHIDADRTGDIKPMVVRDDNISYRMDENNVDIEAQMAALAQNSLHYNTLIQKLNAEFAQLNMAVRGQ